MPDGAIEPAPAPFHAWTRRLASLLLCAVVARVSERAGLFPPRLPSVPWFAAGLLFLLRETPGLLLRPRTSGASAAVGLLASLAAVLAFQLARVVVRGNEGDDAVVALRGAATLASVVLLVELLPIAPLAGSLLLAGFLRRRLPPVIASRIFRRSASSALAIAAMFALVSRVVRSDPVAAGGVVALAAVSVVAIKEERTSALALAAQPGGGTTRAGARRSSSNPTTSSTSSSPTESE